MSTIVTNGKIVKEIPVTPEAFEKNIRHYNSDRIGPWRKVDSKTAAAYKKAVEEKKEEPKLSSTPPKTESPNIEKSKKTKVVKQKEETK